MFFVVDRLMRGWSIGGGGSIEMIVEDGAHRTVGPGSDLQRTAASSIHSVAPKAFVQTDNSHARSKALLRVRPVGEDLFA